MDLRIARLLTTDRIALGAAPGHRLGAIDTLISLHQRSGVLSDPARYGADVLLREEEGSTALGHGLAVPHAKSAGVLVPALCAMTAPTGVHWDSPDGGLCRLVFLIAAPLEGADLHLQILARLMGLLIHEDLRSALAAASTPAAFLDAIAAKGRTVFPYDF